MEMACRFKADNFELLYVENDRHNSVSWENHCHAKFEMIAVLEGEVHVILEGKRYHLQEQQTIIIPPLCYHSVVANEGRAYRRVTGLFSLHTVPEALQSAFANRGTEIAVTFSPQVERLREICQADDPSFYAPLAHSLMVQIFYDTQKASNSPSEPKTDTFLQGVLFYIDQHLHEKISLETLARHTSRSKSSFCHLFEEKMKISPKQYILQKKLALASKLIGEGTPPTVAAEQVGYENYSNFYRLYLKHFDTSPTKRRK